MASQVVQFTGLSDRDRKKVSLPKLGKGDRVELHIRRRDGRDEALALPPAAVSAVETLLTRLLSGERVAVLAEDQELSPTEASAILGISRPLVVLHMGSVPIRDYTEKLLGLLEAGKRETPKYQRVAAKAEAKREARKERHQQAAYELLRQIEEEARRLLAEGTRLSREEFAAFAAAVRARQRPSKTRAADLIREDRER